MRSLLPPPVLFFILFFQLSLHGYYSPALADTRSAIADGVYYIFGISSGYNNILVYDMEHAEDRSFDLEMDGYILAGTILDERIVLLTREDSSFQSHLYSVNLDGSDLRLERNFTTDIHTYGIPAMIGNVNGYVAIGYDVQGFIYDIETIGPDMQVAGTIRLNNVLNGQPTVFDDSVYLLKGNEYGNSGHYRVQVADDGSMSVTESESMIFPRAPGTQHGRYYSVYYIDMFTPAHLVRESADGVFEMVSTPLPSTRDVYFFMDGDDIFMVGDIPTGFAHVRGESIDYIVEEPEEMSDYTIYHLFTVPYNGSVHYIYRPTSSDPTYISYVLPIVGETLVSGDTLSPLAAADAVNTYVAADGRIFYHAHAAEGRDMVFGFDPATSTYTDTVVLNFQTYSAHYLPTSNVLILYQGAVGVRFDLNQPGFAPEILEHDVSQLQAAGDCLWTIVDDVITLYDSYGARLPEGDLSITTQWNQDMLADVWNPVDGRTYGSNWSVSIKAEGISDYRYLDEDGRS
ncbi:MAG: hypothetical protein WC360_08005, partial [Opitutales bacterium]